MEKETVVVTLYPGCISFEVALVAELLSQKYQVLNATPDGKDLSDSSGLRLKAHLSYAQVQLQNCRAVLVPGGDPGSIVQNIEIDRVLVEANRAGLLIGGICAGPLVLAKAGILRGRKIAHGYNGAQLDFLKDRFEGVILTDELFLVDKNIVTAKPEAHIEFAVEFACRLDAVDASKSGRLKEYCRGTLGRKIRSVALALIRNRQGQILLHKAYDSTKKETFYRPLGGGIEFGETGEVAVVREIKEELGLKVSVKGLVKMFENIFVYDGQPGHEIVLLFDVQFSDEESYENAEFDILESGKVISKAVWRSVQEIHSEEAKLYPLGIERVFA